MRRQAWRVLVLLFAASVAAATHAYAQQQRSGQPEEAVSQSGALVALDNGETLWIAPVNGKMQAIAADDYVIPRKDGFWRLRVNDFADPNGAPGQSPWAVRLQDKFPPPATTQTATGGQAQETTGQQNEENSAERSDENQEDVHYEAKVLFLSPDYLSVYMQSGEYFESYGVYQILSSTSATEQSSGGLRLAPIQPPIAASVLEKTKQACAQSDADFGPSFYEGAEESFAIRRAGRRWQYAWMFGYSGGAARGYHTECDLSILPPPSIVGPDTFLPAWNIIKDVYPDAGDAFTSPRHDLILIFCGQKLVVAPVRNGRVGKSLLRLEVSGKPVMVQWATGLYVDKWTSELSRYFHQYSLKNQQ